MMETAPVIGILGGIGSGKSLVAGELVMRGGYLIAGDLLGHEALRQADIKEKVVLHNGTARLDQRLLNGVAAGPILRGHRNWFKTARTKSLRSMRGTRRS